MFVLEQFSSFVLVQCYLSGGAFAKVASEVPVNDGISS